MQICIYGPESDHAQLMDIIHSLPTYRHWVRTYHPYANYDCFLEQLRHRPCDVVFVTENNANGMVGVIATRNVRPELPVVWFSNDEGFGSQAYRLNADFFHVKPLTPQVLEMALSRLARPNRQ